MLSLAPIGVVHNEVKEAIRNARGWGQVESQVVLEERYGEGLDGLEDYSHVLLVFWIDRAEASPPLKAHPQRREELPLVGLFASRSPNRPNPIGITAVPIIGRTGNVLGVRGLDAIDGTPVLDIKPYTPAMDRVDGAQVPDWCKLLYEVEDYF